LDPAIYLIIAGLFQEAGYTLVVLSSIAAGRLMHKNKSGLCFDVGTNYPIITLSCQEGG
jgi:hypothetical protein